MESSFHKLDEAAVRAPAAGQRCRRCLWPVSLSGLALGAVCWRGADRRWSPATLLGWRPAAVTPPHAATACGRFVGRWEGSGGQLLAAFRGVQFGRAARWLPPERHCAEPRRERAAVADGPSCLGRSASRGGEDEECLYLNFFTPPCAQNLPEPCGGLLPILVYIHGGGLASGSATSDGHVEALTALTGEVLVVTCQYRLGVLGFMALLELSRRDPRGTSGNYGILDQQLCLRWVQQHGGAFGGDVSRVTLLGQSAGGTSILAHLASAGSGGLFHRAIAASASPGAPRLGQLAKEAQDRALWLPRTGCAGSLDVLSCLLRMNGGDLARSLPDSYGLFDTTDYPTQPGPEGRLPWSTLCHVDGVTIPAPIEELARHARGNDVPLLVQSMAAEMAGSTVFPPMRSASDWEAFLAQRFRAGFGPGFGATVEKVYRHVWPRELAAYEIDADTGNRCGLQRIARACAATFASPVYLGVVQAGPQAPLFWCDCSEPARFPFHGWDLAAVTEVWNRLWCTCPAYSPAEADRSFASDLRRRWLALIKDGRLDAGDVWTAMGSSGDQAYAMIQHSRVEMHAAPDKRCLFWEAHNVSDTWYWVN